MKRYKLIIVAVIVMCMSAGMIYASDNPGSTGLSEPEAVGAGYVFASVTGGYFHSAALKSDGTVWSWGYNGYGDLGNGTYTDSSKPVQVSNITSVAAIAANAYGTTALKTDGTVWSWGYNGLTIVGTSPVQVSGISGVVAIAAGSFHTLALKSDGTVWAWGYNMYGALGNGTTKDSTTPVQVSGLTGVTAISAGVLHSVALKSDGTVWSWGYNAYGALGNASTTNSTTPVKASNLTGVTAIAAGGYHTASVLKSDGTVWSWGFGYDGELGNGTTSNSTTPVQASNLSGVTAIAGGLWQTIAIKSDGTVWNWGYNPYGELGNGSYANSTKPVQVSGLTAATAISSGAYHSIAVKNGDSVWDWGYNYYGELGNGTTSTSSPYGSNTPVQVLFDLGAPVLISPTGTITTTTPTYSWNAVTGASYYMLYVNDSTGNKISSVYASSALGCGASTGTCSVTPTTALAAGNGNWYAAAWTSAGWGSWSTPLSFTVSGGTLPAAPTLISPTGTISTTTPTYKWNAVSGASYYYLYVNDSTGNKISTVYDATSLGCSAGTGTCSVTPTTALAAGNGNWYAAAWNLSGWGSWSTPMSFTVSGSTVPAAPTLISPTGTITTKTPTYSWYAVSGATYYMIYVNDSTGNKISTTYSASSLGCGAATGTCSVTPTTALANGSGNWYAAAWNTAGWGNWSNSMGFTVSAN